MGWLRPRAGDNRAVVFLRETVGEEGHEGLRESAGERWGELADDVGSSTCVCCGEFVSSAGSDAIVSAVLDLTATA